MCLIGLGTGLRLSCHRPQVIDSPEALLRALQAAGLDYEGQWVGPARPVGPYNVSGFWLKRRTDSRPFEELASLPGPLRVRGAVLVTLPVPGQPPGDVEVTVGPLWLRGDPTEIERILGALGRR